MAADRHEPMVPQRTIQPSTARVKRQVDPRLQHTTATANLTGLYPVAHTRLLLISRPADRRRLRLDDGLLATVTHPSTNRARRRVTS